MNYAILENNIVTNIAIAEKEFADANGWIPCTGTELGCYWDGKNFIKKTIDENVEWSKIRSIRDNLLNKSDIEIVSDKWAIMTKEKQLQWSAYRQELRDIPKTYKNFQDVIWPIKPE